MKCWWELTQGRLVVQRLQRYVDTSSTSPSPNIRGADGDGAPAVWFSNHAVHVARADAADELTVMSRREGAILKLVRSSPLALAAAVRGVFSLSQSRPGPSPLSQGAEVAQVVRVNPHVSFRPLSRRAAMASPA